VLGADASNEGLVRSAQMLEIDYGSPGLIGLLLIICAGGAGLIALMVLMRSVKDAHDEVIEDIHDRGGDLEG
jgi:hypothetical protein